MNKLEVLIAGEINKVVTGAETNGPLTATTPLIDDDILSSLELLQLVMALETALSITIPLDELTGENFSTISDIAALIERTSDAD